MGSRVAEDAHSLLRDQLCGFSASRESLSATLLHHNRRPHAHKWPRTQLLHCLQAMSKYIDFDKLSDYVKTLFISTQPSRESDYP